jgi:transcriptional regulator with XRE-family HTH domain
MMMTSAQCRMARAALGWSARELAREAQVGSATIDRFETGRGRPIAATVAVMKQALERGGVEFRPDGSGRLREAADV